MKPKVKQELMVSLAYNVRRRRRRKRTRRRARSEMIEIEFAIDRYSKERKQA